MNGISRAAIFTCLSLRRSAEEVTESPVYSDLYPKSLLKHMLPNDTRVWDKWRAVVNDVLQLKKEPEYFDEAVDDPDCSDLREYQRQLLAALLKDASNAYENYHSHAESTKG